MPAQAVQPVAEVVRAADQHQAPGQAQVPEAALQLLLLALLHALRAVLQALLRIADLRGEPLQSPCVSDAEASLLAAALAEHALCHSLGHARRASRRPCDSQASPPYVVNKSSPVLHQALMGDVCWLGKTLVVSSSAAFSAEPSAGLSFTTAVSVSRLTAACCTPSLLSRMRFTDAEHPPHFMPLTSSITVSVAAASVENQLLYQQCTHLLCHS